MCHLCFFNRSSLQKFVGILIVFNMAVLFNNADCYSQDNKPEVIPENQIEKELSPQEKEAIKEKDVKIAFILLAGVIFIGGFTILLLLIWG